MSNDTAQPTVRRLDPRCAHFGVCGGCDSQSVPYEDQLRLKRDSLVRALDGVVLPDLIAGCLDVRPPSERVDDAPWGFRHKVHFVFGEADGRLQLAHYAAGGRALVGIRECPAHAEIGNRLARALRAALDAAGVRSFPHGPLRHVVVRVFRAGTPPMVTLVVSEEGHPRLRRAVGQFLDRTDGRVSVFVNVNDRDTPYILGRESRHVAGPRRGVERVGGLDYLLSASSFFQTNVDGAELMVRWLLDRVGRARGTHAPVGRAEPSAGSRSHRRRHAPLWRAVDLYAGVGLFALPLAREGHQVVAVEENPDAIVDGLATLRRHGIRPSRCRFVQSSVRRVDAWSAYVRGPVDLLIVDPPREGVGPDLLVRVLATLTPRHVAYVSCDPTSLARDLAGVRAAGARAPAFTVQSVQPIDMFPHTPHVETLVWLSRSVDAVASARPSARSDERTSMRERRRVR